MLLNALLRNWCIKLYAEFPKGTHLSARFDLKFFACEELDKCLVKNIWCHTDSKCQLGHALA